ncbi:MAG: TspO/MBR family protein [Gammaproteobacteria bacterium]
MAIPELILALVLVALAAAIGARFKPDRWYQTLNKPIWNPPDWLFAPVWSLLYIAIALSAWFAWRGSHGLPLVVGLSLWLAQLVANAAWSWLFFGRHRPDWALVDIVAIFLLALATLIVFFHLSLVAGWLFVPYLAWLGFAACLNAALWLANRHPPDMAQESSSRPYQ